MVLPWAPLSVPPSVLSSSLLSVPQLEPPLVNLSVPHVEASIGAAVGAAADAVVGAAFGASVGSRGVADGAPNGGATDRASARAKEGTAQPAEGRSTRRR